MIHEGSGKLGVTIEVTGAGARKGFLPSLPSSLEFTSTGISGGPIDR
jgi:hypothetical protein